METTNYGGAFGSRFREVWDSVLDGTAHTSERDAVAVASYAEQRAGALATLVGQPGFDRAVRSAANSLLLFAGVRAVEVADELDARLAGAAIAALHIGAHVLGVP